MPKETTPSIDQLAQQPEFEINANNFVKECSRKLRQLELHRYHVQNQTKYDIKHGPIKLHPMVQRILISLGVDPAVVINRGNKIAYQADVEAATCNRVLVEYSIHGHDPRRYVKSTAAEKLIANLAIIHHGEIDDDISIEQNQQQNTTQTVVTIVFS